MLALITGGVRSGKSSFAEKLIHRLNSDEKIYLATCTAHDDEMMERIYHHKKLRTGKGFRTVEQPYNIGEASLRIEKGSSVLFECIGTLLGNELSDRFENNRTYDGLYDHILTGIMRIYKRCNNLVIVSNDVFSDGITYDEMTSTFIDVMGKLHRELAGQADIVVECVYGINICYKGKEILNDII